MGEREDSVDAEGEDEVGEAGEVCMYVEGRLRLRGAA